MRNIILIVDDDDDVGLTISICLELAGQKTLCAGGGGEALEIIKDNKNIKAVISDVRMANGGGLFLLEELKKMDGFRPPIILISGHEDVKKEEALKKGAFDFYLKPLDMEALLDSIQKITG